MANQNRYHRMNKMSKTHFIVPSFVQTYSGSLYSTLVRSCIAGCTINGFLCHDNKKCNDFVRLTFSAELLAFTVTDTRRVKIIGLVLNVVDRIFNNELLRLTEFLGGQLNAYETTFHKGAISRLALNTLKTNIRFSMNSSVPTPLPVYVTVHPYFDRTTKIVHLSVEYVSRKFACAQLTTPICIGDVFLPSCAGDGDDDIDIDMLMSSVHTPIALGFSDLPSLDDINFNNVFNDNDDLDDVFALLCD